MGDEDWMKVRNVMKEVGKRLFSSTIKEAWLSSLGLQELRLCKRDGGSFYYLIRT